MHVCVFSWECVHMHLFLCLCAPVCAYVCSGTLFGSRRKDIKFEMSFINQFHWYKYNSISQIMQLIKANNIY